MYDYAFEVRVSHIEDGTLKRINRKSSHIGPRDETRDDGFGNWCFISSEFVISFVIRFQGDRRNIVL